MTAPMLIQNLDEALGVQDADQLPLAVGPTGLKRLSFATLRTALATNVANALSALIGQAQAARDAASGYAAAAQEAAASATGAAADATSSTIDDTAPLDSVTKTKSNAGWLGYFAERFALKASPEFTGAPTAPTPDIGANSAQIATTAFVAAAIASIEPPDLTIYVTRSSPALSGTPTAPTALPGAATTQIATTAFVAHGLALKADSSALASCAPLASPALTGAPTAPTAPLGSDDALIATTAFVAAAIAHLVNSSPAALDTLNELAAALGDDPNFSATVMEAIGAKASVSEVYSRTDADNRFMKLDFSNLADTAAARANLGVGEAGTRNNDYFMKSGTGTTGGKITAGTAAPSGGSNGDIYFRYTA